MSHETLEERVLRLEEQMNQLLGRGPRVARDDEPHPDEWRTTVGMFRGDPVFKEMIDQAAEVRGEERQRARAASDSDPT